MTAIPRFFYNNDGSFLSNYRIVPPISTDEVVYEALGRLVGTQVDALVVNLFGFGDAVPLYPSDVPDAGRIWLADFRSVGEWREQAAVQWVIQNDPWPQAVEAAHRAGMQFWAGMRFNDIHPRRWKSKFRGKHPEYELGEKCPSPLHDPDSPSVYFTGERCKGYNFAIPEVRGHRLKLVEEVCTRYDVDGFEWDFMRHPGHFFPDVEEGRPILTEYMRQAREALNAIGEGRDRAIGFGVRTPATIEMCHGLGMDVAAWIREGLVDYVSPSPGGPTVTDPFFAEWVELAKDANCRIYACTSEQQDGRWSRGGWGHPPASLLRAGALNAWRQGVDGIYIYNFNVQTQANRVEDFSLLHQLGNPATLEFVGKRYMLKACYSKPHLRAYAYRMPVPVETQPDGPGKTVSFTVGDDLAQARKIGVLDKVELELIVGEPCDEVVEFRLNGADLPPKPQYKYTTVLSTTEANLRMTYDLKDGESLKQGANELHVVVRRRNPEILPPFTIYELTVDIRYRVLPMRAGF